MPNISTRPTQLPEELGMYVDALRKRFPSIDEVWLLGPRANEDDTRGSDWDLLAFADAAALDAIRSDTSLHRDDLNFIVVTDGDRFEKAWGEPGRGGLRELRWQREDTHSATYAHGAGRKTAVRVR